jgi:hypothetical protein
MLAGLSKRKVVARNRALRGAQSDRKKRRATAQNRLAKNFFREVDSRGKNVESRALRSPLKKRARRKCCRRHENGAHEIFICEIALVAHLFFRCELAIFTSEYSE